MQTSASDESAFVVSAGSVAAVIDHFYRRSCLLVPTAEAVSVHYLKVLFVQRTVLK